MAERSTLGVSLAVALGGLLMGFDASVISGVVGFIEPEFGLDKLQVGWVVASLTLTSTLAMFVAGPLSDRIGRRAVLRWAAVLFLASAVASALAPSYAWLVAARMLGGLGVGAALVMAPMFIAEIAPAEQRGRLVSLNQLMIVLGISAAFFSNWLLLGLGADAWRWMLGVEALPALVFLLALTRVPESPRWLVLAGRDDEALAVMAGFSGADSARETLAAVVEDAGERGAPLSAALRELLRPGLRLVLLVGLAVAVLQQATGINAVFFYAPSIFEQSGIGTDAAFVQAVLVGLVNVAGTLVALALIDRIGRKPLLVAGVLGIAVSMFTLAYGFGSATYSLSAEAVAALPDGLNSGALLPMVGEVHDSDLAFRARITALAGAEALRAHEGTLVAAAIDVDATLVLAAVLGFVASFAVSLGPVMWVLFQELFPNRLRGVAVSLLGLVNSSVSFLVQLLFPVELQVLGVSMTFLLYGAVAVVGLAIVVRWLPETRGRTLEQLGQELAGARA